MCDFCDTIYRIAEKNVAADEKACGAHYSIPERAKHMRYEIEKMAEIITAIIEREWARLGGY